MSRHLRRGHNYKFVDEACVDYVSNGISVYFRSKLEYLEGRHDWELQARPCSSRFRSRMS